MSLYHFLKPLTCLPTAEEPGLSARTTEEANKALEEVLTNQHSASARKMVLKLVDSYIIHAPTSYVVCGRQITATSLTNLIA